jgi:hypothetical protein
MQRPGPGVAVRSASPSPRSREPSDDHRPLRPPPARHRPSHLSRGRPHRPVHRPGLRGRGGPRRALPLLHHRGRRGATRYGRRGALVLSRLSGRLRRAGGPGRGRGTPAAHCLSLGCGRCGPGSGGSERPGRRGWRGGVHRPLPHHRHDDLRGPRGRPHPGGSGRRGMAPHPRGAPRLVRELLGMDADALRPQGLARARGEPARGDVSAGRGGRGGH